MMNWVLMILLLFIFLSALRIITGPTLGDRLMALNLLTSKVIMFMLLKAWIEGWEYTVDLILVYALLSFVGIIFITIFIQQRGRM